MAGFDLNSLLNGKSKGAAGQKQETAVAGQGPAEGQESSFEVVMLDVEDLMPSKDNFYTTERINELADAIELSGGIEQNLVVKPEAHFFRKKEKYIVQHKTAEWPYDLCIL